MNCAPDGSPIGAPMTDYDPEMTALVSETKRTLKTLQRVARTAVQLTAQLEERLNTLTDPQSSPAKEAERDHHTEPHPAIR